MQKKNIKIFLSACVTIIIHVIIFILGIYITFPTQTKSLYDFGSKLHVNFVKVMPNEKLLIRRVKIEPQTIPELSQIPKLSEIPSFSMPLANMKNIAVDQKQLQIIEMVNFLDIPQFMQKNNNVTLISKYKVNSIDSSYTQHTNKKNYSQRIAKKWQIVTEDKTKKFSYMLPKLADGILRRISNYKVDIVFIIDITGSMDSSINEIRNYIKDFIKPIEEKGMDMALGLVEYTDEAVDKPKIFGLTRYPDEFKKWIDKIRLSGGVDLPESGYEAIISALEDIEYRKSANRFLIFISDAMQHDLKYDGKSEYTLYDIIKRLKEEDISVDIIGLDCPSLKQIANSTGGQWMRIPRMALNTQDVNPSTKLLK
ncbi:MAG: vWA domain-containing protein [Candidatus Poribacteria bacterium]